MGYTKFIKSGNIIELYSYEKNPTTTGHRKRVRKEADDSGTPRSRNRRPDNLRRLRKGFIRLVRANTSTDDPPALITLTMRANVSLETASPLLTRFFQTLRKNHGSGFRYIAVPEFQKRGAVHYHCLVWGLPEDIIFHETPYAAWGKKSYRQHTLVRRYVDWAAERSRDIRDSRGERYLQAVWGYGYVDCVPTDGSAKLAGYLAKYMSKAMRDERLNNKRAYYPSRNILRPLFQNSSILLSHTKEIWGVDNELISEREFDTLYMGRCVYKLFKLVEI